MAATKVIPDLRFVEFQSNWRRKVLKDFKSTRNKVIKAGPFGSSLKKEFYTKTGYKIYGQEQVIKEDSNFGDYFISHDRYEKLKSCSVSPGDILISLVGTLGKVLLIPEYAMPGIINPRLLRISVDPSKLSPIFLKYYFKIPRILHKLDSLAQGGTMGVLNANIVGSLSICYPNISEQQKISSFLSAVDKKIQLLEKKKELLEQYKKGVMQKLFSKDIRFKRDDGGEFPEWEEKQLSEIGDIVGGGTPSTTKSEFWNGEIPWFTPTEIKSDKVFESQRCISEKGLKKSSAKLLPKGTILLTTRATIGDAAIAMVPCTTNQGFQSIIVNDQNSNIFILNWLKQNRNQLIRRANGSTFKEIGKSDLSKIKGIFPGLEEQNTIGNFLKSLDEKIKLVGSSIEITKKFKTGLLQQMFV